MSIILLFHLMKFLRQNKRTKYKTRHYTDTPYIKLKAKHFNKTYNIISMKGEGEIQSGACLRVE